MRVGKFRVVHHMQVREIAELREMSYEADAVLALQDGSQDQGLQERFEQLDDQHRRYCCLKFRNSERV